jgi:hypothetical protein
MTTPCDNLGLQRDKPAGEQFPAGSASPLLYTAHNLHPAYSLRYDWTG